MGYIALEVYWEDGVEKTRVVESPFNPCESGGGIVSYINSPGAPPYNQCDHCSFKGNKCCPKEKLFNNTL